MSLSPSLNCFSPVAIAWLFLAVAASAQPAPDPERIRLAREAAEKAETTDDQKLLAEAYYQYGKAYSVAGDFPKAHDYFIRSLSILEPLGDSFEVGRLYLWLSDIEGHQRRDSKALEYALHSEKIFKRIQSEDGLTRIYSKLGGIYKALFVAAPENERKEAFEKAVFYLNQAGKLAGNRTDTLALADVSRDLGGLFFEHRDYGKALAQLETARELYRETGRSDHEFFALMHMVSAYCATGRTGPAQLRFLAGLALYKGMSVPTYNMTEALMYHSMRYYATTGNWPEAFRVSLRIWSDDVKRLNVQNDSIIRRLSIEYETSKKEAELDAQRTELGLTRKNLRLQTGFIAALLVLFAGAIGTGIVLFRLYRKNKRINAINASLVREQNHRVKNNLQVMASMLHLQSRQLTDEAARQALSDSRLRVQYMAMVQQKLYDGDQHIAMDLRQFIPELADMTLAACGYSDVEIELDIEEVFLPTDLAIPLGMIVNELITNSCKYAFPYQESPVLEIVCIKTGDKKLQLTVSDNGKRCGEPGNVVREKHSLNGVNSPEITRQSSFGMELIRMQAGQLEAEYRFSQRDEKDSLSGLTFTMEFTF